MKYLEALREIFKGRKTYGVGIAGVIVAALTTFGIVDLDLTVGEQVQVWLGSFATISMRAAVASLVERLN